MKVKVGDEVLVDCRGFIFCPAIVKVIKLDETDIEGIHSFWGEIIDCVDKRFFVGEYWHIPRNSDGWCFIGKEMIEKLA